MKEFTDNDYTVEALYTRFKNELFNHDSFENAKKYWEGTCFLCGKTRIECQKNSDKEFLESLQVIEKKDKKVIDNG